MELNSSDKYKEIDNLINNNVDLFCNEIKITLMKNARLKNKDSWLGSSKEILILKLTEEFVELLTVLRHSNDPYEITLEATDLAAVSMMIHDNYGIKLKK